MSEFDQPLDRDLFKARIRVENLEQDLSDALHVLHGLLVWTLAEAPPDHKERTIRFIRAKLLQMPQGTPFGRRLVELDEQLGSGLETNGAHLKHWVYEPREK